MMAAAGLNAVKIVLNDVKLSNRRVDDNKISKIVDDALLKKKDCPKPHLVYLNQFN
jgi:hypothetical protein